MIRCCNQEFDGIVESIEDDKEVTGYKDKLLEVITCSICGRKKATLHRVRKSDDKYIPKHSNKTPIDIFIADCKNGKVRKFPKIPQGSKINKDFLYVNRGIVYNLDDIRIKKLSNAFKLLFLYK